MNNYTISDIEALTEEEVKEMAEEVLDIKGYTVYFVDFAGYFGYSAVVFKNDHQIRYANDYEWHHAYKMREEGKAGLRRWYIDAMNRKLFTEEELMGPIKDYDEYTAKSRYLRDYHIQQIDYVSAFYIVGTEEEKQIKEKTKGMVFNPLSFCYVNKEDVPFCIRQNELFRELKKRKEECEQSYDYMKSAFVSEMYNHEYSINWQADYDTLSAFGSIPDNVDYEDTNALFDALHFTDVQRSAYKAAKREYYRQISETKDAM